MPSLKLLGGYLRSLELDFHDLQEALDQVEGKTPKRMVLADKLLRQGVETLSEAPEFRSHVSASLERVDFRLNDLDRRLRRLEGVRGSGEGEPATPPHSLRA